MFKLRVHAILPLLVLLASFSSLKAEAPKPEKPSTEKLSEMRHFFQRDPRANFPNDGREYCCPATVSESFAYLAAHGYPKLLPQSAGNPLDEQFDLVRQLASPTYMHTDPDNGTGPADALKGIKAYVEAQGYACKLLQYSGWRPVASAKLPSGAISRVPSLDAIKQATADPAGAVWLNIGWYVHGNSDNEWKRVGGHWVCVIGYGTDGAGHDDPNILLIDDPAVRQMENAGGPQRDIAAYVLHCEPIAQGRFTGETKGLPISAVGYSRVSGAGLHIRRNFDAAFLDAAIMLILSHER